MILSPFFAAIVIRLHHRGSLDFAFFQKTQALLGAADVDCAHVLLVVHRAAQHRQRDVVRARVEIHRDGLTAQVGGNVVGRVRAHHDGLRSDRRALADDFGVGLAILRATDLSPFARAIHAELAFLDASCRP